MLLSALFKFLHYGLDYDTHCYDGFWSGSEGQFELFAKSAVPKAQAADKPLSNTEYIELFGAGRVTKWLGRRSADVSTEQWELRRQDVYAQFILEQTEALRRLGYDGTLPYAWCGEYVQNLDDPDKPASIGRPFTRCGPGRRRNWRASRWRIGTLSPARRSRRRLCSATTREVGRLARSC